MSPAETTNVPYWPKVYAIVRPDGSGEVTINGTSHPVTETTVQAARNTVLHLVRTQTAQQLGRPVRVDTSDPDGQWQLIVHPDGGVQSADPSDDPLRPVRPTENPPAPEYPPAQAATSADEGASWAAHDQASERPVDLQVDRPMDRAERRHLRSAHLPDAPAAEPQPFSPASPAPAAPAAPFTPSGPVGQVGPGQDAGHAEPRGSVEWMPTLDDLIASRPTPRPGPARMGWQGRVRRATGGLIKPTPGAYELEHRAAIASVQRSLTGPKTVVVVNPKGGAHKTTATLLLAATFGIRRGGYTLAWDNNETRGTLGWRANPARHTNTAVDLLRDLERFTDVRASRVGDLDNYVRAQGSAQFDVLASDEDAASAASIDADAFQRLHQALQRFYRIMVIDTGNNMRASNWQAAIAAADQLVIVSTVREDTAQSAAWLVDALRSTGKHQLINRAVTVLSAPARTADPALRDRLHHHFGQLTRTVLDVPHDPTLVAGGPIDYEALAPTTRDAWLRVSAAVADGL